MAPAFRPDTGSPPACDRTTCIVTTDGAESGSPASLPFAVLVAGTPIRRSPILQARGTGADLEASQWLEGANAQLARLNPNPPAPQCAPDLSRPAGPGEAGTASVSIARTPMRNDVVVAGRTTARP